MAGGETEGRMAEIRSVELNAERAAERARREQQAAAMTARERARIIARERALQRSHRPLTAR